ncbi:50S ribosomal protein L35 [Candidatus Uhrbacteria bacterium]|nr:50S ribosomal protein L35 [Candidatus Uhrbacteria bacterium]
MKLKTPKSLSKRFKITRTGKVLIRKGGQDHFNAREPGKVTREKRRDVSLSEHHAPNVKKLLPYAK